MKRRHIRAAIVTTTLRSKPHESPLNLYLIGHLTYFIAEVLKYKLISIRGALRNEETKGLTGTRTPPKTQPQACTATILSDIVVFR